MNSEYKTGVWKKTSKQGNNYYTGKLKIGGTTYRINLFKNNKQNDKQPDINVILREEQEQKEEIKENYLDDKVFADFGDLMDAQEDDGMPF